MLPVVYSIYQWILSFTVLYSISVWLSDLECGKVWSRSPHRVLWLICRGLSSEKWQKSVIKCNKVWQECSIMSESWLTPWRKEYLNSEQGGTERLCINGYSKKAYSGAYMHIASTSLAIDLDLYSGAYPALLYYILYACLLLSNLGWCRYTGAIMALLRSRVSYARTLCPLLYKRRSIVICFLIGSYHAAH
jgi:hypothetical protein